MAAHSAVQRRRALKPLALHRVLQQAKAEEGGREAGRQGGRAAGPGQDGEEAGKAKMRTPSAVVSALGRKRLLEARARARAEAASCVPKTSRAAGPSWRASSAT